jgi:hypothetical protein
VRGDDQDPAYLGVVKHAMILLGEHPQKRLTSRRPGRP